MTIANAAPDVKKGFPNLDAGTPGDVPASRLGTVSYTHLTLPTKA